MQINKTVVAKRVVSFTTGVGNSVIIRSIVANNVNSADLNPYGRVAVALATVATSIATNRQLTKFTDAYIDELVDGFAHTELKVDPIVIPNMTK